MKKEKLLEILDKAESEKRALTDEEKEVLDSELENKAEDDSEEEEKPKDEEEKKPEEKSDEEEVKEEEERNDEQPDEEKEEEMADEEEPTEEEKPEEKSCEEESKEEEKRNITDNNKVNINKKMEKRFSLVRAIRSIANNQALDAVDAAVIEAGRSENRNFEANGQIQLPCGIENRAAVTVTAEGEDVVPTDLYDIWKPLRAKNVLVNAGAKVFDNLVGDVQIPLMGKGSVTWEAETANASDGAPTFSHVKLSPKRLTAYVAISKQMIAQDSIGVENAVREELVNAINAKLEETLLGDAAGTTTKPEGIFHALSVTSANTVSTFADICGKEADIEDENVTGECVYVMSNKAKAALRAMAKGSKSTQLVYENGEVDGTKSFNTSNIAGKGFIYGDFGNLVIGNWGGLDITVDPYTLAGAGQIKLVVNMYVDAKLVRPEGLTAAYVA